jgi:hypothetical protein
VRQPGGDNVEQTACKTLGRLVREAGKDHLIETGSLCFDRRHDARMPVAVGDDPPRGHGIEDPAAIRRLEPGASARRSRSSAAAGRAA